jgi:hypothetical protein
VLRDARDFSGHSLRSGFLSVDEAAAQRGAMSAIVVNQDGHPGQGFFDVLKDLGRDVSDKMMCWSAEVSLVHASWKGLRRHATLPAHPVDRSRAHD